MICDGQAFWRFLFPKSGSTVSFHNVSFGYSPICEDSNWPRRLVKTSCGTLNYSGVPKCRSMRCGSGFHVTEEVEEQPPSLGSS